MKIKQLEKSRLLPVLVITITAFIMLLGGLVSLPPSAALAEGDASTIKVLEQSTESAFREYFIFRLRARSEAGNIIQARIIWQERATDASTAERIYDFRPGREVSLEYVWYTRWETTPPFQFIHYRWELTDSAGNIFLTPREKAEITDETRDWQKLVDGKIAVYWYDQSDSFGERLLESARAGYEFIVEATGFVPEDELRVVMYNDQESFCDIFALGGCRDWYAGVTFGSVTVQWLIEDEKRFVLRQVVPHELAHAFLNDWLDGRSRLVPIWFNEGQATNNELEGLEKELDRARDLASTGKLARLPMLDRARIDGRDSSLQTADWYAQATSLVAYLYRNWGSGSLGEIVERVREGQKFDKALEEYTGVSLAEFENGWRRWLGAFDPAPTIEPTPTLFIQFPPTPTYEPTPIKR